MPYVSTWRFARIPARKARLLTDLIRNKPVGVAMDLLKFSKKRAAIMVGKVLKSAIANAGEKEAEVEELFVQASFCDDAPIMKRMMPKDRGKSYSIFKRSCHITVVVEEGVAPDKKRDRKEAMKLARDTRLAKKAAESDAAPAAKSEAKTEEAAK